MVSGSISLPSPGFFSSFPHGTCPLSVANSYLALDRGRPGFRQDFSCPAVLRYCTGKTTVFRVRGFHPLCQAFPKPFRYTFALSLAVRKPVQPYNPRLTGLGSSNFARHYFRNLLLDVFSLSYLDGSVHSVSLYLSILFKSVMIGSLLSGYPIRLSPDHRICAPPRSFSQLITAFFAGWLQDIHHKPILRLTILFSLLKKCSIPAHFLRKNIFTLFSCLLIITSFSLCEKQATPFQQSFVSFPSLCFSKIIA